METVPQTAQAPEYLPRVLHLEMLVNPKADIQPDTGHAEAHHTSDNSHTGCVQLQELTKPATAMGQPLWRAR